MSANLKPTTTMTGELRLTRFCGPQVELGTRQCLQLTAWSALGGVDTNGYVQLTQDQALELAEALVQFARGLREEV
jgi:hypothetical protein